ncbi:hypothetical protein TNCV_3840311 [Trichonephila clavipes]|nr:hypothetical protein TNCV_3840311 [Trichonephila clavipes]
MCKGTASIQNHKGLQSHKCRCHKLWCTEAKKKNRNSGGTENILLKVPTTLLPEGILQQRCMELFTFWKIPPYSFAVDGGTEDFVNTILLQVRICDPFLTYSGESSAPKGF